MPIAPPAGRHRKRLRVEAPLRTKKILRLGILSPTGALEKPDSVWYHVVGEPDDPACKGWLRHVLRQRSTRPERYPLITNRSPQFCQKPLMGNPVEELL